MAQRGCIEKRHGFWVLRFREPVVGVDGKKWKEVYQRLAPIEKPYLSKRAVEPLAKQYLDPLNAGTFKPAATQRVKEFIERVYFPNIQGKKRPSTVNGYRKLYQQWLAPRLGDIRLRDFSPNRGKKLLGGIEAENPDLSHSTLKNIRHFLSSVFSHAVTEDLIPANVMREVKVRDLGGARSKDTYAYSLDEILAMLRVLEEPAKTVVATAAFTGLRLAELRGLRWEDLDGDELKIQRTVWGVHVGDTKTPASRATVPVIPLLQRQLEAHRNGFPADGFIFAGVRLGRSLNMADLAWRSIIPTLKQAGIEWHGWHAFRRGLATNLHTLGVDGKDIQTILRHSNIGTTLNIYVRPDLKKAQGAMAELEKAFKGVEKLKKQA